MHHLVVHGHCVGSSLAEIVLVSIEVTIGRVASEVLIASMDGRNVLGASSYNLLLHSKLVIEVLNILEGLLVVLLRVLIVNNTCSVNHGLLLLFVGARFIFRQSIEIKRWHI